MRTMFEKDENHRFCWRSAKSHGDQAGKLSSFRRCTLRSDEGRGLRLLVWDVLGCSCSFGSLLLSAIARDFCPRFRLLVGFLVTKLSTFEDAMEGCAVAGSIGEAHRWGPQSRPQHARLTSEPAWAHKVRCRSFSSAEH